jgi:SRSO17 transposase
MQGGKRKKNMLHMAEVVPETDARNLQQFLTHSQWDARAVMDHVAQEANQRLGDDREAGYLIDESGFAKQGRKSVGVARQWLGRLGKVDNGQVAVFGALCQGQSVAPVEARLYLPKEWTDDPQRCAEAGIPESEQVFRTKDELAIELVRHARQQGLKFGWVGADAGYGKGPDTFYRWAETQETFFIEIPSDFSVYRQAFEPEAVTPRRRASASPQYRTTEPKCEVRHLPELADPAAWTVVTVRETTRGPLRVRAWRGVVWIWEPTQAAPLRLTLVVSENLDGTERKYLLTNAPDKMPLKRLVFRQRQRYWVERMFEDGKGTCGMADYQVQKWSAWHHHMALVMLAMWFMVTERWLQHDTYPLLSCADIEALLVQFLPRRDLEAEEVIRQMEARHRLRERAIRSHARCAKRRINPSG